LTCPLSTNIKIFTIGVASLENFDRRYDIDFPNSYNMRGELPIPANSPKKIDFQKKRRKIENPLLIFP
jgi:hypothetical protein